MTEKPTTETTPKSLNEAFLLELDEAHQSAMIAVEMSLKMSQATRDRELCRIFERYAERARDQTRRVGEILVDGQAAEAANREGVPMNSFRKRLDQLLAADVDSAVLDAFLVSLAQKVAHLQISSFGTLCVWARTLGAQEPLQKLKSCLSEAKGFDARLSDVAEEFVNRRIA